MSWIIVESCTGGVIDAPGRYIVGEESGLVEVVSSQWPIAGRRETNQPSPFAAVRQALRRDVTFRAFLLGTRFRSIDSSSWMRCLSSPTSAPCALASDGADVRSCCFEPPVDPLTGWESPVSASGWPQCFCMNSKGFIGGGKAR